MFNHLRSLSSLLALADTPSGVVIDFSSWEAVIADNFFWLEQPRFVVFLFDGLLVLSND